MKGFLIALVATLALAISASAASAANVYVETTGSDSGSCGASVATACATIAQATTNAVSGDTVKIGAGTFTIGATINPLTKSISYVGSGPSSTTVSGNDSTSFAQNGMFRFQYNGTTGAVRDMTISHWGKTSSGTTRIAVWVQPSLPAPVALTHSIDLTVDNVHFIGNTGVTASENALYAAANAGSVTFTNNDLDDVIGNSVLLEQQMGAATISNNTIDKPLSSSGAAIFDMTHANASNTQAYNVTGKHTFDNNTINASAAINMLAGWPYTNSFGPSCYIGGIEIKGNTINTSTSSSAAFALINATNANDGTPGRITDVVIQDNTLTGSAGTGINLQGGIPSAQITGNSIRNRTTGILLNRHTRSVAPNPGTFDHHPTGTVISANQIVDNTSGVTTDSGISVDANLNGNWWGCNEGPLIGSSPTPGDCDTVTTADSSAITLSNWIVLRLDADPSSQLSNDGVADLEVGFDQLNTGGAAPQAFADGTIVPMGSTSGALSTATPTLTSGLATPTFTSSAPTGRSATATFDHESVTHEWDDDTTAPVVTITSPTNGSTTTDSSVDVNYTVTDFGGDVTCDLADGESVPLDFGDNTITVSCEDGAGNTGTDSVTVRRLDVTAPVVAITAPTSGTITSDSSVTLHFTVTDDTATTCNRADGDSIALSEGVNTITVVCTDAFGNVGYDSVSVTRDTTAPVVTILSPPDGLLTNQSSVVLNYTVTEPYGTPTCTIADGATINLDEGENTILVECTDSAGNVGSDSVTVTRDSIAPDVSITAPADNSVTSGSTTTLHFTATDAGSDFTCDRTDGDVIALTEGVNTITVTCTDDAGNVGTDSVTVTRDSIAPQITITAPINNSVTTDSTTTLHFTVDDATDVTCDRDDGDTINLTEGSNTITVQCTDEAGNIGSASVTVIRDNTAPVVTIITPPDGTVTKNASIVVSYTVTDNLTPVTCNRTNPSTVSLSEGANTITVQCTDAAGNVGSDTVTVTRDSAAPVVTITAPADGLITKDASTTLTFTVSDDTATTCNRTSGSSVALTAGVNTITVVCTDAAGNVGFDSVSVIRDNTAPVVTIVTPADGLVTNQSSVILNYSVANNYGTVTCDVADGSTIALSEGANTIEVECTDQAGNVGSDSVTVTRDTIPPAVMITAPVDGSSTTDATTTLHYSVYDVDGADCTPDDGDAISLDFGVNTITVTCTDPAGNVGSDSVQITRMGTVPPVLDITAPSMGAIVNGSTATLTYNAASQYGPVTCNPPSGSSVPLAVGTNTITVTCTDIFGNSVSQAVTVYRPDALPQCAKDVVITSVYRIGSKTRIVGRARLAYVGKKVKLQYQPTGSKTIAQPIVQADGSFSVNVSRPSKPSYTSNSARYRAILNNTSTSWIKLTRRMGRTNVTYDGNGKLAVNGSVSLPIAKGQPLRVERSDACGAYRQVGWLSVRSNGDFNGSVATGGGSESAVYIRLRVQVAKASNPRYRFNTYSIVQPVVVDR
ncbi:MAG: hypothetical protein QM648_04915 [Solirubrobacterales bacterium]